MSEALIRLRDASVRLGDVTALREATLSLHRGERVALVGANGSGKTTLLRALHGLLPLSSGDRVVAADAATGGRPARQAMLFQKPFVLSLSVQANLALALWLAGVPKAERATRAARALERVGLAAQAGRRATRLSVGQQQRVALARALSVQPQVLLLDEPTASLDPGAKRDVEALVAELADEGWTLVFSSHNLGQVKRLATRVLYLDEGRIAVDRPVADFFDTTQPSAATAFLRGEMGWA